MYRRAPGATVDALDDFNDALARWIEAEAGGDAVALDALLDRDFQGDGPRGYVLTKEEWLDRYRCGDFANDSFAWTNTDTDVHDGTAVAVGVQTQTARYQGQDCSGHFKATLVAVRRDQRWSIVNLQLSRLSEPPTRAHRPEFGHPEP